MIRATFLLAVLAVGSVLTSASHAAEIAVARVVTQNGMTVLIVDQPSLPIVTVTVLMKAGAVYDPDAKAGLSYMVADMLDEGTKTRSAVQLAEQIEFIGGELTAQGGEDSTTATLRVLKKDADLGFTLLADILRNPTFEAKEVTRVRDELVGFLKSERDEPGTIATKAFNEIVFKGHPYQRPANGDEMTVSRLTRQDLVEFHNSFFRPNRAIMAIVGDVRKTEALDLVKKYFGSWTPKALPLPAFPTPLPLPKPMLKLIDKDLTQATIVLGHVGIERRNPDFYAVAVMNYILGGGGFSSRLVHRIRDEQGLAYDVDSVFEANVMPGPFAVRVQTRNAAANQALASVLQELKRIRTEPVSDQELADAKAYLIGSFPLRMDTAAKLASLLNLVELHGLGLSYFDDYPKAIASVTKEDVLRVARTYLNPDLYALVIVGKLAEAKIDANVVLNTK
ncbi:MAG: insulinase family protein [Nitrospirae bacterium]|nr:MAG: insulinase family protein [Nitrospirota bacterium]